jgi:Peptidase A4 family
VPSVAASRKATYSSNWVGIDGYNNNDLIQTGTESDYYNGSAHYAAWWEILPAAETVIPSITVRPGDIVTASITKSSGSSWTIKISDGNQSFTTTRAYSGPQTSAEWIEEAPEVGGRVAPLANYGHTTFDPGTVNGGNPKLAASEGGVMVQKRAQVSTPSTPDSDTDRFNIAYGATAPLPPPSLGALSLP